MSFDQIIRTPRRQARILRRARRMARVWTILTVLLATLAILLIGIPVSARVSSGREQTMDASRAASRVAGMSDARRQSLLDGARAYNRTLASSGQHLVGEAVDPFNGETKGDFSGSDDTAYTRALDVGDGVMGSITIPSINVNLPIRHGSASLVLQRGAGHIHGTSLPVGGRSTHAAITGHRGLADKLMFTRLDEMKQGTPFYIHTLGRTLAYRVTDIRVVDPQDVDTLRIVPGRDLVTLVTCTPYGINTQRLLVTGERARMPQVAPYERDAPTDARNPALTATAMILLPGWWMAGRLTRRPLRARHRAI